MRNTHSIQANVILSVAVPVLPLTMAAEIESLETLITKAGSALDEKELSEMKRILYGTSSK